MLSVGWGSRNREGVGKPPVRKRKKWTLLVGRVAGDCTFNEVENKEIPVRSWRL